MQFVASMKKLSDLYLFNLNPFDGNLFMQTQNDFFLLRVPVNLSLCHHQYLFHENLTCSFEAFAVNNVKENKV